MALGIHQTIINRVLAMLGRLPAIKNLAFAGGVAINRCIQHLLEASLQIPLLIPDDPQIVGALGAAIYGSDGADLNQASSMQVS